MNTKLELEISDCRKDKEELNAEITELQLLVEDLKTQVCHCVVLSDVSLCLYNAMQYNAVQCNAISTVQHSTAQCSAVQCSAVQYSTVQYNNTIQYDPVQYNNLYLYSIKNTIKN